MYYSIDCYYGNGKSKDYPSDHICFFGDTVKEIMDKFIFANKNFIEIKDIGIFDAYFIGGVNAENKN